MKNENSNIVAFPKGETKKRPRFSLLWIGSVAVFILAAASFVFIPSIRAGSGRGGDIEPFGYYNKKPIALTPGSFFARQVERFQEEYRAQGISPSDSTFQIFQSAFNSSVLNEAFSYAVGKSGYIVPEAAVDRAMIPYFRDESGAYSPKLFNAASQSSKLELRKALSENLVYMRYYEDLFGTSENVSGSPLYGRKSAAKEAEFLQALAAKERGFQLAAFDISGYPKSEAAAFGREHSDLFAKYDFSVITVNTEDEAKKLLRQINNGEIIFEDGVKNLSAKYYSGEDGKLTSSYYYQIKNLIAAEDSLGAVIALEAGGISEAVQTTSGYSIFRCDSPAVQSDFEADDVIEGVQSYLKSYERGVIEEYYSNIAKDFAAAAARDGFEAACAEFNTKAVEVSPFPLNYGNAGFYSGVPVSSVAQLSGAETNENFLRTAFSLKEGEISSPLVLGNNVLVLKLTEEKDVDVSTNIARYLLPDYSLRFDQTAVQTAILADKGLKNDFFTVFFKYYGAN
ncbi:MAG: peptidylprolyl isomerase [Spirochaetaceae bacterium]|jgi:parvulin-like peptidyl-prolyl isomerase|nr:peptidylprolyl isomerase [Spirochaetaceae bacterium]